MLPCCLAFLLCASGEGNINVSNSSLGLTKGAKLDPAMAARQIIPWQETLNMQLWYHKLKAAGEKAAPCPKQNLAKELQAIIKGALALEAPNPKQDVMHALVDMVKGLGQM